MLPYCLLMANKLLREWSDCDLCCSLQCLLCFYCAGLYCGYSHPVCGEWGIFWAWDENPLAVGTFHEYLAKQLSNAHLTMPKRDASPDIAERTHASGVMPGIMQQTAHKVLPNASMSPGSPQEESLSCAILGHCSLKKLRGSHQPSKIYFRLHASVIKQNNFVVFLAIQFDWSCCYRHWELIKMNFVSLFVFCSPLEIPTSSSLLDYTSVFSSSSNFVFCKIF